MYAADDIATCVAEVFQEERSIDRASKAPWLVSFWLAGDLTLLDLTGAWPTAAGASMALCAGPRSRARRWSQVIYDAYPEAQGLWYPSSMHGNRPAVALYERAATTIPVAPTAHMALSDPRLGPALDAAAGVLGYNIRGLSA